MSGAVDARRRPPYWLTALFAVAFAVFGTIQAVYVLAGEETYRALVLPGAPEQLTIALPSGGTWYVSREVLVVLHRQTLAYVLGDAPTLPNGPDRAPVYTPSEISHFDDVRRVFAGVRVAWVAALLVLIALVLRGRLRGYLARLVRDGALGAAALVLVIAVVFAVAFEPAFLAFHYIFFPEGNFLFDPATSNMLLVYPERYWYGITLRVGIAFISVAVIVAVVAALLDRQRSAIVPTR